MKRLTEYTIPKTGFSVVSKEKYKRIMMEEKPSVEKVYNRLKKVEDILGDEYDLERLRELVEADRVGHCIVFDLHYPVVSEYYKDEGGLFIREASGVISKEEYEAALRREQDE